MLSSDASLGMWATDGGRRADSSTRFPGASSYEAAVEILTFTTISLQIAIFLYSHAFTRLSSVTAADNEIEFNHWFHYLM
jgi:hypothetical protein